MTSPDPLGHLIRRDIARESERAADVLAVTVFPVRVREPVERRRERWRFREKVRRSFQRKRR